MNLQLRIKVATRVLNYTLLEDGRVREPDENNEGHGLYDYLPEELPAFEEDIDEAMKVVNSMGKTYGVSMTGGPDYWQVSFGNPICYDFATDEFLPTAICKAAMITWEIEKYGKPRRSFFAWIRGKKK